MYHYCIWNASTLSILIYSYFFLIPNCISIFFILWCHSFIFFCLSVFLNWDVMWMNMELQLYINIKCTLYWCLWPCSFNHNLYLFVHGLCLQFAKQTVLALLCPLWKFYWETMYMGLGTLSLLVNCCALVAMLLPFASSHINSCLNILRSHSSCWAQRLPSPAFHVDVLKIELKESYIL